MPAGRTVALWACGRTATAEESSEQIQAEITRSRHYQRPLSVIAVGVDGVSLGQHVNWLVAQSQAQLTGQYVSVALANEVRHAMRSIDMVLEAQPDGSFLVLCPEADHETAVALAGHVRTTLEGVGVQVNCAAATCPDEGLTFAALVTQAQSHLRNGVRPSTAPNGHVAGAYH